MATTVTYKGNQLVSFDSGTKTLETAGKYCEDDITVTSTGGDPYQKWKEYIARRSDWSYLFADAYTALTNADIQALNLSSTIQNIKNMQYMFWHSHLTSISEIDVSNIEDMNHAFYQSSYLTTITLNDTSNVTNFRSTFQNCPNLATISELDISSVTSASGVTDMFSGCGLLQNIIFEPNCIKVSISFQYSQYLTDDSLISIANGLDGTQTNQTLKLHSRSYSSVQSILGYVDPNTQLFIKDNQSGSLTLENFIVLNRQWGVGT